MTTKIVIFIYLISVVLYFTGLVRVIIRGGRQQLDQKRSLEFKKRPKLRRVHLVVIEEKPFLFLEDIQEQKLLVKEDVFAKELATAFKPYDATTWHGIFTLQSNKAGNVHATFFNLPEERLACAVTTPTGRYFPVLVVCESVQQALNFQSDSTLAFSFRRIFESELITDCKNNNLCSYLSLSPFYFL